MKFFNPFCCRNREIYAGSRPRKSDAAATILLWKGQCPGRIVEKYFEGMEPNQVDVIVEQALEAWFSKEAANV